MVRELLEIDVKAGQEAAFEAAVEQARRCFLDSAGCRSLIVHRSLEQPSRYRLLVDWDSVEDHMIGFRQSEAFLTWRRLVGAHFATTPRVEHLVELPAAC